MDNETFDRVIRYLGLQRGDRRAELLRGIFTQNLSKSEAAKPLGFTPANAGLVVERALRDLRKAGDLTGVYLEPVIRRGIPGRKTPTCE